MGEVYLIRHGQTTCNADGIVQGPRVDSQLSDVGRAQAAALGDAFIETALDAVFCSPMARARVTADALVQSHPGEWTSRVVPEMYEMDYGVFCGQRLDDVQDEMRQVIDAWALGFPHEAFPGGESALITQHRIRRFADRLLETAQNQSVAVVAHGRVNRVLVATLLGATLSQLEEFPQDNANITQLSVEKGRVVARRINDTSHLEAVGPTFS